MADAMNAIECIMKIGSITCLAYEAYKTTKKQLRTSRYPRPKKTNRNNLAASESYAKHLQSDEELFYRTTRMNVSTFKVLLELLRENLQRYLKRKAIVPEVRLCITLSFLAEGCTVKVLALTYKIGISTVRKVIYETCTTIWKELQRDYVSPPSLADWRDIANVFYMKTGIPNCLGAVDGKHINIMGSKKASTVSNYKKRSSVALLAACNSNYVFTFVDIGPFGCESDNELFIYNSFGREILNGSPNVPAETLLPDGSRSLPYYFVAADTFPLKYNLMRPFPGRNLPGDEELFNRNLYKIREYTENAFGILACRWRVLQTDINANVENVDKIVLATIVLHNFLILQHDSRYFGTDLVDRTVNDIVVEGSWRQEANSLRSISCTYPNRCSSEAFEIRNILKDFLYKKSK